MTTPCQIFTINWQHIVELYWLPKFPFFFCDSNTTNKKTNLLAKITSRFIITIKISKPGKLSRAIKLFLKSRFYFFRYFNLYCVVCFTYFCCFFFSSLFFNLLPFLNTYCSVLFHLYMLYSCGGHHERILRVTAIFYLQ